MKICIRSDRKKFTIKVPNILVFSRLGWRIFEFKIARTDKSEIHLGRQKTNRGSMKQVRKCIKQMHKIHPTWKLVDVQSADGTGVEVVI